MFFPSPPLDIWWKKISTIFSQIWLVFPRPHANYTKRLYPFIPVDINYSGPFTVQLITNYCTLSGITLSAFCVKIDIICIWMHIQCQRATLSPMIWGIWTSFSYHIYRCISTLSSYIRHSLLWRKWHRHEKLHVHGRYESNANVSVRIQLYTLFQYLM